MRGNIAQMMQQAQRMQENMKRAQEELAALEVTGSSGGGMVSITLTGKMETRKVRIDPSLLADGEMLEDLIAAAVEAHRQEFALRTLVGADEIDRTGSAGGGTDAGRRRGARAFGDEVDRRPLRHRVADAVEGIDCQAGRHAIVGPAFDVVRADTRTDRRRNCA
mgnify:CR=1 FL=1